LALIHVTVQALATQGKHAIHPCVTLPASSMGPATCQTSVLAPLAAMDPNVPAPIVTLPARRVFAWAPTSAPVRLVTLELIAPNLSVVDRACMVPAKLPEVPVHVKLVGLAGSVTKPFVTPHVLMVAPVLARTPVPVQKVSPTRNVAFLSSRTTKLTTLR